MKSRSGTHGLPRANERQEHEENAVVECGRQPAASQNNPFCALLSSPTSYDVVDHGFVARRATRVVHIVRLIGRYPGDRLLLPLPQGMIRHGMAMPRSMTLRA